MSVPTEVPVAQSAHRLVHVDLIDEADNVRALDLAHVDDLAASIALRGVIVPLVVRPSGDGRYRLVAGHHRLAACLKLGHTEIPVTVRDQEGSSADAAAENVVRKALTPLEEARAVQAMFDEGYTADGAADILGWSKALVTARAKILELPPTAQTLVGAGAIPLRAVDGLLRINGVAPALVDTLTHAIEDGEIAGHQLVNNLSWTLGFAMRHTRADAFAAYLHQVDARTIDELKLGKKATTALAEAEAHHKKLDQYAYGPPVIRFAEVDVDQARAAGVLIELDDAPPIIVDRKLYRELCKGAIARTAAELAERVQQRTEEQRELRAEKAATPKTPREELDAEHRRQQRDHTQRAHTVNLDLGAALVNQLSAVAVDDINVTRFFAYGLLGPDRPTHMGVGDNVARTIAANGLRLVLEQHRTVETKALKGGGEGKAKVAYGEVDDAQAWLWTFVDGAKTAAELYGRVIVVFAAQHYAFQIALPTSQRRGSVLPSSHKDIARKAFEKIAKQALPGTHTQLSRAIARAASAHAKQVEALNRPPAEADPEVEPAETAEGNAAGDDD